MQDSKTKKLISIILSILRIIFFVIILRAILASIYFTWLLIVAISTFIIKKIVKKRPE